MPAKLTSPSTFGPASPILVVENADTSLLRLSVALRQAGLPNPLLLLPDADSAARYLGGSSIYSDRKKYPLPRLMLLDVTLPKLNQLDSPGWLTPPPAGRQVVIADLRGVADLAQFDPATAFGPDALVCKFTSANEFVSQVQEWSRSQTEVEKLTIEPPALRAA